MPDPARPAVMATPNLDERPLPHSCILRSTTRFSVRCSLHKSKPRHCIFERVHCLTTLACWTLAMQALAAEQCQNHLDLCCPLTTPLYLLSSTNMLPSSTNSPGASLHQTHGFPPPSAHFGPPFAMLKTSGNVLTLLLTGPPSSLSATNTTSSSCLPKKSTSPASYTHPLLLPLPLISQSSPPPQNPKSIRSCPTVQTAM